MLYPQYIPEVLTHCDRKHWKNRLQRHRPCHFNHSSSTSIVVQETQLCPVFYVACACIAANLHLTIMKHSLHLEDALIQYDVHLSNFYTTEGLGVLGFHTTVLEEHALYHLHRVEMTRKLTWLDLTYLGIGVNKV